MAALDNPFYFSLADEDRIESAALLRPANSLPRYNKKHNLKPLLFNANNQTVKYYNVRSNNAPSGVDDGFSAAPPPTPTSFGSPQKLSTSSRMETPTGRPHSMANTLRMLQQSASRSQFQGGLKQTSMLAGRRFGNEMLDVVILSSGRSDAAKLWVKYLSSCFQQISKEEQRPPFKLNCINVDDMLSGREGVSASSWTGCCSRLQVVVVCPLLLDSVSSGSVHCGRLAALLQPATVVAMLLGVTSNAIDNHPLTGMFRFDQWRRMVVKDQDPTFVGDLMGVSMDILSRSWQLKQAIHQMNPDNNKAHFSLIPKKIKVGQNKVIVLLTTPLSTNDKVNIFIDRNGQKVEVTSIKRRNPYTLQFSMPVVCLQTSMLVGVNVERNGRSLGQRLVKCESRLRELDQLLRTVDNPLHFMCQALGMSIGDRDQLDNFLVNSLQQNTPPNFNLLAPSSTVLGSPIMSTPQSPGSTEEYPTLLHFAARFGLEKVCWQLLEWGGYAAEQACQMRNAGQLTPAELAERAGHPRLANALKGYQQMTELTSMYHYVKGISEKSQETESGTTPVVRSPTPSGDEANYLLPRPLSDTYLVPPTARPLEDSTPLPPPPSSQFYYKVPGSPVDFCPGSPSTPPPPGIDCGMSMFPPPPSSLNCCPYPKLQTNPPPLRLDTSSKVGGPLDSYQTPGVARPFTPVTPTTPSSPGSADHNHHIHQHNDFAAYLQMHSPVSDQLRLDLDFCHGKYKNVDAQSQHSDQYSINNGSSHGSQQACGSSTSSGSTASCKTNTPQDELVEIINDFKNNVFTISEVEKLVEAWRNRNDVQQSFREKQEQLNQMRQEYERIQYAMKEQMKRATPFERIKKFFSRKSKHIDGTITTKEGCIGNRQDCGGGQVCHRPVSSLSLHSSSSCSSCGRMSTGSGTSLGDSGTHSDHDDKKSEDFIYHEKLQAVKENDSAPSSDEYIVPSAPITIAPIPHPPNTTVALIHKEYTPEREEEEDNGKEKEMAEEKAGEDEDVCTEEMDVLEQGMAILENMAGDVTIACKDLGNEEASQELEADPHNQENTHETSQDLEVEEASRDTEEESTLIELPDYVNVCPLLAPPPPIPPRVRYKGVLL